MAYRERLEEVRDEVGKEQPALGLINSMIVLMY